MTNAAQPLQPPNAGLAAQLERLVAGRTGVLDHVVTSARQAQIGALLLIGSLGRGGGDAFSDLDLIAVPGPHYAGLDLAEVFDRQVLAKLDAPRNAPMGGDYLGLCLEVAPTALWVDWYLWPSSTAVVPADATPIYDDIGLAASDQDFVPLINAHNDPTARAHPAGTATELLRVAVAAKYLARRDLRQVTDKLHEAQGLSLPDVPDLLRRKLASIMEPGILRATTATRNLVDLAAAVSEKADTHSRTVG